MQKIKNTLVESTPVEILEIKDGDTTYTLKSYWSKNSGIYGYQVCYQILKNYSLVSENKTGGCGYCKLQHALDYFVRYVINSRDSVGGGVRDSFYEYNKGGNFYSMTLAELKKEVKQ